MNKILALIIAVVLVAASDAFAPQKASPERAERTLLNGGFLEGKGKKVMVRVKEDNDMWIESPGDLKAAADKKAAAKKGAKGKKKGGFKFPWDK